MANRRRRQGPGIAPWLFISPWIIGFLVFTVGPLLFSLYMSFFDWPIVGDREYIGIDNYQTMLTLDPQFWESLWITVKFAAIYVPFNIVMSFLIALMLHHATFASGYFRTAFYLPSVISGVALVTIWSWIYSREYGLLNFMLSLVGIDGPNWLGDPGLAIIAIHDLQPHGFADMLREIELDSLADIITWREGAGECLARLRLDDTDEVLVMRLCFR